MKQAIHGFEAEVLEFLGIMPGGFHAKSLDKFMYQIHTSHNDISVSVCVCVFVYMAGWVTQQSYLDL